MTDSSVRVPEIPRSQGGREIDCNIIQRNGVDYYQQRVILGEGDLVNDAWGSPKVSLPYSIFHGMFTFDIPANMWFTYENGTQVYTSTNVVSSGGAATLTTSATKTALILESRECPRYQPNRGHLFSTAVWCPSKTNDGIREWGLQTTENGVFFRLKSNGLLYACLKSGGSVTKEELIDTSIVDGFDVQKGNVYDIQYQWRGVGNYKFFINLTEVHVFSNLGTLTALSMQNPALPISFRATRTTQDVNLNIGCADISSENGSIDTEQYQSAFNEGVAITTDTPIITVYNPLQINSVTNTRTCTLARISLNASKRTTFRIWLTRNPAAFTGMTLQKLGGGSFVQCDSPLMNAAAVKATAFNTALAEVILSVPIEAYTQKSFDNPYRGRIEFPLVRGDYLVITATGSGGPTGDAVVEWGEQV